MLRIRSLEDLGTTEVTVEGERERVRILRLNYELDAEGFDYDGIVEEVVEHLAESRTLRSAVKSLVADKLVRAVRLLPRREFDQIHKIKVLPNNTLEVWVYEEEPLSRRALEELLNEELESIVNEQVVREIVKRITSALREFRFVRKRTK